MQELGFFIPLAILIGYQLWIFLGVEQAVTP